MAVQESGAGVPRYRVAVDLAFKETAGRPARITTLHVEIAAASGWSVRKSYEADLPVTALGEARYSLASVIDDPPSTDPVRWRLSASGVDPEGRTFSVPSVEATLSFKAAPKPAPTIVVTPMPTPLVAQQEAAGAASRHRVTADVLFRESAGAPARITRLTVEMYGTSGWSFAKAYDVDLPIAALGEVRQTLVSVVDVAGRGESARWRLTVSAKDQEGMAFDAAPAEAEVIFPAPPTASPEIFVGAGDIAKCGVGDPEATAKLLDRIPGTVFTLGDNVQGEGAPSEYTNCYEPSWGRHRQRTRPTPGNHDWNWTGGGPYFAYFGPAAGPPGLGYYSFTLGAWQIISLNSNLAANAGSPQYEWLKAELAASASTCTLVMWHHPLFSSGTNGNSPWMRDAWRLLYQFGADLVLSGHDHVYERFAPQDADGRATPRGIRQFTVGTGGYSLYDRGSTQPNSEVFENRTWGVLKLNLKSGGYDWEFVPVAGRSFTDSGSADCVVPGR